MLNTSITEEEIMVAISGLTNGKAPGPDGYTAEFYKMLRAKITPSLLAV